MAFPFFTRFLTDVLVFRKPRRQRPKPPIGVAALEERIVPTDLAGFGVVPTLPVQPGQTINIG